MKAIYIVIFYSYWFLIKKGLDFLKFYRFLTLLCHFDAVDLQHKLQRWIEWEQTTKLITYINGVTCKKIELKIACGNYLVFGANTTPTRSYLVKQVFMQGKLQIIYICICVRAYLYTMWVKKRHFYGIIQNIIYALSLYLFHFFVSIINIKFWG